MIILLFVVVGEVSRWTGFKAGVAVVKVVSLIAGLAHSHIPPPVTGSAGGHTGFASIVRCVLVVVLFRAGGRANSSIEERVIVAGSAGILCSYASLARRGAVLASAIVSYNLLEVPVLASRYALVPVLQVEADDAPDAGVGARPRALLAPHVTALAGDGVVEVVVRAGTPAGVSELDEGWHASCAVRGALGTGICGERETKKYKLKFNNLARAQISCT